MKMKMKKIVLLVMSYALVACVTSIAVGAQPFMNGALISLQEARSQLVQANSNKGGHRDRAINLIDQAIIETNLGINYAAGH
jgi:hypothetical protein